MEHDVENFTIVQSEALLGLLQVRFEANMVRHKGLEWNDIQVRLQGQSDRLRSLSEMERTGGEPDAIGFDEVSDTYLFYDCSPESPIGRRSLCYDRAALEARKNNKPEDSACDMAALMGIEILSEEQYGALQALGAFDTKTSSWIATPDAVRKLGGALFCDRRYDRVFAYHNGADSYYAARGFRGVLRV
jgi:hypothetical protein